jgi:hypothetical protein
MIIKQLSIFLENKTGRLTDVAEVMHKGGINISALSIADTSEYGILRLIVNKPDEAYTLLKSNGFSAHITEVIGIVVPNEPGGLYHALKILTDEKIDVEYLYAFALNDRATVIIRTDTPAKAIEILQKNKLNLIKSNQIYEI